MSTKLHAKSYSNNDKLFFLLNPSEDIAQDDPVRIVDAIVESLTSKILRNCTVNAADAPTIRR